MPRRSKYQAEFTTQARKLCRLGATDADLADFFGVAESTLNEWKLKHPPFAAALAEAKAEVDAQVVRRLYERAMGYEHPAVKIITVADGNNQGSHVEQVPYIERYPPDTTACIFWLKNRQPRAWRDKQDVQHSGPNGGPISVESLTPEQREARVLTLMQTARKRARA